LKYKEYDQLRPVLAEKGFKSLREDAVLKWAGGVTTAEEIFRVT
jgi:type II secretory ATPase GspE/PulE/Tfp pilus assembly ATPase PilB-like protein